MSITLWLNDTMGIIHNINIVHIQEPFITSDEIENAIISYTITYSDSNLDTTCWSRDMQPSLFCEGGVCRDTFDITSSHCPPSADINISVSAISTYGKARLNQHPLKRGDDYCIMYNHRMCMHTSRYRRVITCL